MRHFRLSSQKFYGLLVAALVFVSLALLHGTPAHALTPPTLTSVSPSSGLTTGGDTITVTGTGLTNITSVQVDGNTATGVTIVNDTTLTFTTPPRAQAGSADVTVEDSSSQTATLTAGFTYFYPSMTISGISPSVGPIGGGQSVTISGSNFSPGFKEISQISAGNSHACGLYEEQAYCWGDNTYGQLGNGTTTKSLVPVAVDTTGALNGKTIRSISAVNASTCAIASDNLAYCWGDNTYGQLGNGTTTNSKVPVAVAGTLQGRAVTMLSTGYHHSCAITADNYTYCWGLNNTGQLGNNSTTQSLLPVAVNTSGVLSGMTIQSIASGNGFTCAIASNNQVYCWGDNSFAQLGNGTYTRSTVPVAVTTTGAFQGKTIKSLTAGDSHACVIASDNQAYCWGYDSQGQLGTGYNMVSSTTPVAVQTSGVLIGKTIKTITAGSTHTCAVASDNQAYCWGNNPSGQLGNGTITKSLAPVAVSTDGVLQNKTIKTITAGSAHTCAIASDNQAYCWGHNNYGQLGNNSLTDSTVPVTTNIVGIRNLQVTFGGVGSPNVTYVSPSTLTAVTPPHTASDTDVTITRYDNNTTTSPASYTYVAPPILTSVSPSSGLMTGGDIVTLTGSNFTDAPKIKVGSTYATNVTRLSDTSVSFVLPAATAPGTVDITAEDDYGSTTVLAQSFTYMMPNPTVGSLSPAAGPMNGGTVITIHGSGFMPKTDGGTWYTVLFGAKAASNVTYVDSQTLQATSPSGNPGTVDISVTSSYTDPVTLTNSFLYTAQKYAFLNNPLALDTNQPGQLVIQAQNSSGAPVSSTSDTTITLASSSSSGAFARDLTEDSATRWTYTSVVLPAGAISVNVWYKDTKSGTPTITATTPGGFSVSQQATISSPFRFVVSGVSDPIQVGEPSSVTLRVVDRDGNQRTDYTGTLNFSSNDPVAHLPASYTMKASDYGIKTFTNGITMGSTGDFCVTATDTDDTVITGQQCAITVGAANVGTISQLAITTPAQRVTAGRYSSPITIQAQDSSGKFISVGADTSVYLFSNSSTGQFSTDGTTWSSDTPFKATIPAGASSVNVYFKDDTSRSTTLSARDLSSDTGDNNGGDFGWKNATQTIVTGVSPPTQFKVTGKPALIAGEKGSYAIGLEDEGGNPVTTDNDITIRVDGDTGTAQFYTSDAPTVAVPGPMEFIIPAGSTGTTLGVSDTTLSVGTNFTTLNFTDARPTTDAARLQDSSLDIQIVKALPASVTVTAEQSSVSAGQPVAVDIQLLDSNGQPAVATAATTLSLADSAGEGEFSLTASPFTPISSFTLSQGEGARTLYFRSTAAGTTQLSASASGLVSTPGSLDVTTANAVRFGITAPLPASAAMNASSEAFTVSTYDTYGNIVIASSDTTAYLYSNQPTISFAASQTGPWNVTSVIIPTGQSSVQFYVKDSAFHAGDDTITVSDAATLDNPDTGLTNASAGLAITSQSIASIVFTSGRQTIVAGHVSQLITVELRQSDGTPAYQDGSTSLNLTVGDGKLIAVSDLSSAALASMTVDQGSAQASFYYTGQTVGSYPIVVALSNGDHATSQLVTVTPDVIAQAAFQTQPRTQAPNTASSAIEVILQDAYGNVSTSDNDTTLTLASSCADGSFSLSDNSWQTTATAGIPAGSSSATFYYKGTTPGSCTLSVSSSSTATITQSITVTSFAVANVVITTTQQSITAGSISDVITVNLQTADGSPAYQDGSTHLQLSSPEGTFLTTNDGSGQAISNLTIASGQASASFYYKGTRAGTFVVTIGMDSSNVTTTQSITVTPASASRLKIITPTQTIPAGSPSQPIRVDVQDSYGNSSTLTSDKDLALATTCTNGTFSEDPLTWQPITSLHMGTGASDATFYYKDITPHGCTLTVTADGLANDTQLITITTSTFPTKLSFANSTSTLTQGAPDRLAINLLDEYGNITPASVATTVYLDTDSTDGTFSASPVVFEPGTATMWTTYTNRSPGTVTLTARDQVATTEQVGSLTDTSTQLTYIEGTSSQLVLSGPSTARAGETTNVTISLENSYDIAVPAEGDTIVSLTSSELSGVFMNAAGDVIHSLTIPQGDTQIVVSYRQTASATTILTATAQGLSRSDLTLNVLPAESVYEMRFINQAFTGLYALETSTSGTYKVGLYDEFGNVTTATGDTMLYAHSDSSGTVSNNGRFVVAAGNSMGTFSYSQATPGQYTMTVSDSPTSTPGALGTISQAGEAVASVARSLRFTTSSVTVERGEISQSLTIELLTSQGAAAPAVLGGQSITLSMKDGSGRFATTPNGTFASTLTLFIPSGQTSTSFYYRNDSGTPGDAQTISADSWFAGVDGSATLPVNLSYGVPVQLAFTNAPITVAAGDPSAELTVEQQNQYGRPVPVSHDTFLYLSSSTTGTPLFGSSKTDWGVTSITIPQGSASAHFYYQDSVEGEPTLTAADSLPINPDLGLANANQTATILAPTPTPRVVDNFLVTNVSDPQQQGTASSVIVIARDANGYVVPTYDGTISFSSDDPQAQLPAPYTFNPAKDRGVKVFTNQIAFALPGERFVSVSDSQAITGTQSAITVTDGNSAPVAAIAITQPASPVTIAPNTASPNMTLELHDANGQPTIAPTGGMPVQLTSTSATGSFATSLAGPWQNSLTLTIPAGFSFANVYYRDSQVGDVTVRAVDWQNGIDSSLIANGSLEVLVHKLSVDGSATIQSLGALGDYEPSSYLFAHTADGAITGTFNATFTSHTLLDNALTPVHWQTQWRHGVSLLQSSAPTVLSSSLPFTISNISATAGDSDFYAVAEATDTSFADVYNVVSKQIQVPVSPWKASIATASYGLQNSTLSTTINFSKASVMTSQSSMVPLLLPDILTPSSMVLWLLPSDTTSRSQAVYTTGKLTPSSPLNLAIPLRTATLGKSYRVLVASYDQTGNTTAEVLSEPFTVLATALATQPGTTKPGTPDTLQPPSSSAASVTVTPPAASSNPSTPDTIWHPHASQPNPSHQTTTKQAGFFTPAVLAAYGSTAVVLIFLIREAYKEAARIHRLRAVLRRERQLASDKDTFLSLGAHYLHTPIAILDAAASMLPSINTALSATVASLRLKADALLENGAATELADINNPDIARATRSAFRSIFFWLPLALSIILTIAVNALLQAARAGTTNDQLVYATVIGSALLLIVFFGARTVYINREVKTMKEAMELHRAQLFNAKTNFILNVGRELKTDIDSLKQLRASTPMPDNVNHLLDDSITRLSELTTKLSVAASINGVVAQPAPVSSPTLLDATVARHQADIVAKQLTITKEYENTTPATQDERLLSYVTSTVLDNAIKFSRPGSTVDLKTASRGNVTTLSITNDATSDVSTEATEHMFEPFNHATSDNALTADGMGLSLYLDKLIMGHLGGSISARPTRGSKGTSVQISFPSLTTV